jgi:hypothetical protein
MAIDILDMYEGRLGDYNRLLDIAVKNYLLIVALDESLDEHLLRYETPLHIPGREQALVGYWRRLMSNRAGYYIEYKAHLPSTLRAYHLVVETASNVSIEPMFMSTGSDAQLVSRTANDLEAIAARWASEQQQPNGLSARKLLELQSQTVVRRLSELVRRRRWEADNAGLTLETKHLKSTLRLVAATTQGEAVAADNGDLNHSILLHPFFTIEDLKSAASEIRKCELGRDLSLENDPSANRAHVYWRRSGTSTRHSEQTAMRCGLVLRDTAAAGPRNVVAYAVGVASVTYAIAAFLTSSAFPYSPAVTSSYARGIAVEPMIAILLLVPGFLYARLSLPPPSSISGYLGTLPRLVAHVSIISMAGLAAVLASGQSGWILQTAFLAGTAVPLTAALLLVQIRLLPRKWSPIKVSLARMGAPAWAVRKPWWQAKYIPNVEYHSTGSQANDG